jgi:preprotein translocase subunit SecF
MKRKTMKITTTTNTFLAVFLAILLVAAAGMGIRYGKKSNGASKAERVRMELEVAQAEQDVAQARVILNRELAKPAAVVSQLSPEDINAEIEALQAAGGDLARKSNRLKVLKEAAAKLNR